MEHAINTIRFLGVDAVNEANSGHPGIVLGAAPMMYTLWTKHLKVTPKKSDFFNRDRFILAAGHGSAMLYASLHLAGFDVSIEDLKQFRQLGSKTPGHPEFRHTDGVDSTSGPLGQGIAMASGMAIAERYLGATFNKEGYPLIDHYTYALCGDGDLQEGVTQEAMSLAGHLGLEKLIVLYDSNDIQLDQEVSAANSEDVKMKYESMNWHYQLVKDGNDVDSINQAILEAKKSDKPSIIEIKTIIGFASSVAGDSASHGSPIGKEEAMKVREKLGYKEAPFEVADEVYKDFQDTLVKRGDEAVEKWTNMFAAYREDYPELAEKLEQIIEQKMDVDFDEILPAYELGTKEASRATGGALIPKISEHIIGFVGGSADLTKSTKAKGINGDFSKENPRGRNISFGVREHAMAAIVNGMTLHHLNAFSGGFFVFSDYMKPAMRMAAIMRIPSTYIFTHDSVAVGEDGPTHEPIEQLTMFRAMPNLHLVRPADANETRFAFRYALESKETPVAIALSRQNLEVKVESTSYEEFKKGAYVISDKENFEGILIATGSEVGLALDVQEALAKDGINVRVVSMPSYDVFRDLSKEEQEKVLPSTCTKRLAIEMGATDGWYRFADHVYGLDRFGESAPGDEVIAHLGFTVENLVKVYKNIG